ncbi:epoxide hydrolase [Catellatospora sp. KI3]|uniref:epoxide hydrolase family protein n=1 Tax=Catellatospora sp. KI3 TaxID=3041620 RepID=UPI00248253B8|nr:epoxide hydrolase family protein [Catellatospora sp. KI3]MDI1459352.1 epoxide hydrolase [Catellatospora sp. KI3]
MRPFLIEVPDGVLDDLRERVVRTRFGRRSGAQPWDAGADPDYLAELLDYWAEEFDWRAQEQRLNAYPQFLAEIDGQTVHFVHVRGKRVEGGPPPLAVIVTHGWPYSFIEMLKLVPLLTDPAASGADPADAFDVVIPSLPGYGFSDLPFTGPSTKPRTADVWAKLMTGLGYRRFGTSGEDVGAGVSDWLAVRHPEKIIGLYAAHAAYPPRSRRTDLTPAEDAFLDWLKAKWAGGEAYAELQATRPDTLAAALLDSPAGLAAWLVEKFRAWSDCGGELERRWSKDDLLTVITLYWVTETVGTAMRPYFDEHHEPVLPQVKVPAGVSVSLADQGMPRELAERTYTDLRFFHPLGSGGHFVAFEEPEQVAEDMREFFRPLRGEA